MTDAELEAMLRRLGAVEPPAVERCTAGVQRKLATADSAGARDVLRYHRHRRGILMKTGLAAAVLLATLVALLTWQRNEPLQAEQTSPDKTPPTASVPGSPQVIVFHNTNPFHRVAADMDYTQLSLLAEHAKVVVVGRVRAVVNNDVTFEVQDVLRGTLDPSRTAAAGDSAEQVACMGALTWKVGEECVIFLTDAKQGTGYQVLFDGSGKHALPFKGQLTVADLRMLLTQNTLPTNRIAALVHDHGLNHAAAHLPAMSTRYGDPRVQAALVAHYVKPAQRRGLLQRWELVAMLENLLPETLRDDSAAIQLFKDSYPLLKHPRDPQYINDYVRFLDWITPLDAEWAKKERAKLEK